ncbi:bifunctional 3'-5' exonuclease/ATP-dependent helicase WRN-like [Saccostrea cucullata]|uniref:bifunctional 3'-5' exonuclease/ATP-dependent helicase WRN-like n=1 Tax=Saccostrea cuccullata TaxID=36930 RepID=UPI002ED4A5BE
MGLDVKAVDTVVHYGPANDIDDYLQETGRAGRDPLIQSHAILLLYKRSLGSRNITSQMKEYTKSNMCRRQCLLKLFENKPEPISPMHNCSDNCRKICSCSCKCSDECSCEEPFNGVKSKIFERIVLTNEEDSDDSQTSDEGLSDDSEFIRYLSTKPVLNYSSDED